MRLFLDANVLFSAAYSPAGRAVALFRLSEIGRCTLIASPHVIEEATRNVAIKVPDKAPELARFLTACERAQEAPSNVVSWAAAKGLPENDAPVLAAAASCGADMLVTGDRTHFGHLFDRRAGDVLVCPLRDALARMLEDDGS